MEPLGKDGAARKGWRHDETMAPRVENGGARKVGHEERMALQGKDDAVWKGWRRKESGRQKTQMEGNDYTEKAS